MDVIDSINAIYSSRLSTVHTPHPAPPSQRTPTAEDEFALNLFFGTAVFTTMFLTLYFLYQYCIRPWPPVNVEYTRENIRPGEEYWHRAQPPPPRIRSPRRDREFDLFAREHRIAPIVPLPEVPLEQPLTFAETVIVNLKRLSVVIWSTIKWLSTPVQIFYAIARIVVIFVGGKLSDLYRWYYYEWEFRNIARMWWEEHTAFLYTFKFWAFVVGIAMIWNPVKHTVNSVHREWSVAPLPLHTPIPARHWSGIIKDEPAGLPWCRWPSRVEEVVSGQKPAKAGGKKTSVGEVERLITVTETLVQQHIETMTQTQTVTETQRLTETVTEAKTIVTPKVATLTVFEKLTRPRPDAKAGWTSSKPEKTKTEKKDGWWYCSTCRQKHCCEFS
ncbi:hypothetical protein MBLNU457_g0750t1 [Dothideomycetes sp. NU457]